MYVGCYCFRHLGIVSAVSITAQYNASCGCTEFLYVHVHAHLYLYRWVLGSGCLS